MDYRRLDTGAVIASGIPDKQPPKTDIPQDREGFDPREARTEAEIITALDAGKLVDAPEYYGCLCAWKDADGYHGRLLQYRSLTERPDYATAAECAEWVLVTLAAVEG